MSPLQSLQQGLQDLYELDVRHDIGDYLVSSRQQLHGVVPESHQRMAHEQLYLYEEAGELNLSLYLDESILKVLECMNPDTRLDGDNLEAYCLALEGVSHFLYLVWNATYDRPVSLLELELQAEIDKFLMVSRCLNRQGHATDHLGLSALLFERYHYHDELSERERRRYRQASVLANRYCRTLICRYAVRRTGRDLLGEVRRFYRMNGRVKLERIHRLH